MMRYLLVLLAKNGGLALTCEFGHLKILDLLLGGLYFSLELRML